MAGEESGRQDALTRRGLLAAAAGTAFATAARAEAPGLVLNGQFIQGGFAMGRAAPRAKILLDGQEVGEASAGGLFVVGFDRDAADAADIAARTSGGQSGRRVGVAKGTFDIQRINGLPEDQVTPTDPALLARIAEEVKLKAVGFSSRMDSDDFRDGFVLPVQGARLSARFGGQRILNGTPMRPHFGDDLAAPVGTPVHAPAAGVVSFARTGLHYEGGLIMIDHGQGLISLYLHLSRVDVVAGQTVSRGQLIGAVGQEGRATGPHLCWRLKWRGRNLDPMLLLGAHAPDL